MLILASSFQEPAGPGKDRAFLPAPSEGDPGLGRPGRRRTRVVCGSQALTWEHGHAAWLFCPPAPRAADRDRQIRGRCLRFRPGVGGGLWGGFLPFTRGGQHPGNWIPLRAEMVSSHSLIHSFIHSSQSTCGSPGPARRALVTGTPPTLTRFLSLGQLHCPKLSLLLSWETAAGPECPPSPPHL